MNQKNLKTFLKVSLSEIFRNTVNSILDSVDQTLEKYQGVIRKITTENEILRKRLQIRELVQSKLDSGNIVLN